MRTVVVLTVLLLLVPVPLLAQADDPACLVSPSSVDFGSVDVGDSASVVLTVTNFSEVAIFTRIYVVQPYGYSYSHPDFSIPGADDFFLGIGESKTFTLYFHPQKEGTRTCSIKTGYAVPCPGVPCRGEGFRACLQQESAEGFGEVVIGRSRVQSFAVYGIEGRTVRGNVRMSNQLPFRVVSGGGPFIIGPGEYHEVGIEFSPHRIGYAEATLMTGLACGDFTITGAGIPDGMEVPNPDAAIMFHVKPHAESGGCPIPLAGTEGPCSGYTTSARTENASTYDVYVLLTGGQSDRGFAGADFGITYTGEEAAGVDVRNWTFCGALQFPTPDWPAADEGNLTTWNHETDCKRDVVAGHEGLGVHALIGVLEVDAYSMDVLRIVPRPHVLNQGPHVSDCQAQVNQVVPASRWGAAVFSPKGKVPGCNPCLDNCGEPVRALCSVFPQKVRFGMVSVAGNATASVYVMNPFPLLTLSGEASLESEQFAIVHGGGAFSIPPGEIHEITVRYSPTREDPAQGMLEIAPICQPVVLLGRQFVPEPDGPTAVEVTDLAAEWAGDAAAVRWRMPEFPRDVHLDMYRQDTAVSERRAVDGTITRTGTEFTVFDPQAPAAGADYWLLVTHVDGEVGWHGPAVLSARRFSLILGANHPNPFASSTGLSFEVPAAGRVVLCVYDLAGREVARLVDADLPAGRFEAAWDGRDGQGRGTPAGIYLLRLVTRGGVKSRKLTRIG